MTDLEDTIEDSASKPASASSDAGSVSQRSLGELIEADRYLESKRARSRRSAGLSFRKIVPPGTISESP